MMNKLFKYALRALAVIFGISAAFALIGTFTSGEVRGTGLAVGLIPAALAAGFWYWAGTMDRIAAPMVCTTCGKSGSPVAKTRGSILIEIVLWLCFLVPGLIYSLWRLSTRTQACPSCGGVTLVPPDSPVGRKLTA